MNSPLYFSPVLPLVWLLAIAMVLILFLGWLESRKPYRFKTLRVIAQTVAVLSVLAMTLRPSWDVQTVKREVALLTDHYTTSSLDSLMEIHPELSIVRAPGVARPGTDSIRSYRELMKMGPVRFVLGDGIPTSYRNAVPGGFQLIVGRAPAGVVALYNKPYPENRKSWLTGKVRYSKGLRLSLRGPGGVEDSLTIRTNTLSAFQLGFSAKIPGKYVYTLTAIDSIGIKTVEDVPVEVSASRKLSVLLLQAFPQAEVRFLKNYLTTKGHRLVTRYTVSRNVFRYEVANGAQQSSGGLDAGKLKVFDLVVLDAATLDGLGAEEVRSLEQATRNGMGVLVLLEGLPDTRRFPGSVMQLSPVVSTADTIRYSLGNFGSFTSPFTSVRTGQRVQSLLRSGNSLLQGLALFGEGKVAVQALRETYRLALGGDNSAYAALWTPLLEQSSRREDVPLKVYVQPFPVYPDEPVEFELIGPGPMKVTNDKTVLPLTEDVTTNDVWHGSLWAGAPGWQQLTVADTVAQAFFVSRPGAWQSVRKEMQRSANRNQAFKRPSASQADVRREEFPPLVFFLLFLMAAGFVWMAPKI